MPRYFIEVAYKGTNYSGFQIQQNANSIQAEIEKALRIFFKQRFNLTGSSRTDAGVHALQNFFHFDVDESLIASQKQGDLQGAIYNLNAILPWDISINNLLPVTENAHCRYDAMEREYTYYVYRKKAPFLWDRAYYFPYRLNLDILTTVADIVPRHRDFTSFSKRSTQVDNFLCTINKSTWLEENDTLVYTVCGNRFLRGMVRGLVGTMLKAGREIINEEQFESVFKALDCTRADFSAPARGLFLKHIKYPSTVFLL
ncbi:MAG: tRNA pseudouridine(38-40) synthase TruA [Ginsengibacter sp.]